MIRLIYREVIAAWIITIPEKTISTGIYLNYGETFILMRSKLLLQEMNSMINKEFAAIVLAMGLIVSIGIVLSQENIGYIGGLGATSEMNLYTPITPTTGEITGATSGYTLDNLPEQDGYFAISDRDIILYPFDRYKILFMNVPTSCTMYIECYQGINFIGIIEFLSDEVYDDTDNWDVPYHYIAPRPSGVGEIFWVAFPESKYDEILTILGSKNSLAVWIDTEKARTHENDVRYYGIVTTSTQQVGG